MHCRPKRRSARKSMLIGGGLFLLLMVALGVTVETRHRRLIDVEYFQRRDLLRRALASHPNRPLCLVVGSSRLAYSVQPEWLTAAGKAGNVLLFNFAHLGAGPVMNLIMLHRILADGVRPDAVILELIPAQLAEEEDRFVANVVLAEDVRHAWKHFSCQRLVVSYLRQRVEKVPQVPLHLLGVETVSGLPLDELGGYRELLDGVDQRERSRRTQTTRRLMADAISSFRIAPRPESAFRASLALCRAYGIKVVVVLTPEGSEMRRWYLPEGTQRLDDYLREIERSEGTPVVDARCWLDDGDFSDEHHVLRRGAEKFTARFGRDVVAPLMNRTARPTSDYQSRPREPR